MLVMPNVSSYFGRITSRFLGPYANTVGLNAGWNFFSPEPAHPMYLKILVNYPPLEDGSLRDAVETFYPSPENDKNVPSLTRKREWALMRFMVLDAKKLRLLMGPWLCKQYPGAVSVDMEHIVETIPILDQAVLKKDESVSDISEERKYANASYSCDGSGDEEAL
ncbi:MAG: hypothetical protein J7501_00155 [Bdellovibrio sp.]|nr:hypothetical protein [Bdellovibrio sp.]